MFGAEMQDPTNREPSRLHALLACALVALALLALGLALWNTGPCDDDYIVYRYARNLVEGLGPVFNAGERVEGYTCPLWMLILSVPIGLSIPPFVVSPLLGLASALGAAWVALLGRGSARRESDVWAALAIALSTPLVFHAVQGLGTALAALLLAGWYAGMARAERGTASWHLPAALLGLATLLRPESLVLLPVFGWCAPRDKRLAALGSALLAPAAWLALRLWYYGEWLPMSFFVKKLALADDLRFGLSYLGRATLDSGIGALLVLALVARTWGGVLRTRSASAALFGALLVALGVVWTGGDYMYLARFFVPILPLVLMLCMDALGELGAARPARVRAGGALLVLLGLWPLVRLDEFAASHAFYEGRWSAIGEELRKRAPAGFKLASSPVGAIGWHSRVAMVDMLGITNAALRDMAPDPSIELKGHQRSNADWVLAQQPDAIVLGNGELDAEQRSISINGWERALYLHPRFAAEYELCGIPIGSSYPLPYFQRRGGKTLPGASPIQRR